MKYRRAAPPRHRLKVGHRAEAQCLAVHRHAAGDGEPQGRGDAVIQLLQVAFVAVDPVIVQKRCVRGQRFRQPRLLGRVRPYLFPKPLPRGPQRDLILQFVPRAQKKKVLRQQDKARLRQPVQ